MSWVSVKYKLPDQYDRLLVSDGNTVTTSYFQDGCFVGREVDIEVTHWMLFPGAPAKEG